MINLRSLVFNIEELKIWLLARAKGKIKHLKASLCEGNSVIAMYDSFVVGRLI